MNKKSLICIIALLLSFGVYSQGSAKITGHILDAKTQKALYSANIFLVETEQGSSSNEKGYFEFNNLKAGTYTIKVKFLGYIDAKQLVSVSAGETKNITIELNIDITQLLGVEIRDDRIDNHPYSKTVIKKATLQQEPVRDIGDFLRSIPNIGAVRKGGANLDPVIRGFKFDQLNIQLDNGQSMEGGCPNRMDPTSSHIEADDIEAIEVFKGPYALRYGPTMGGAVNILTINPRPFDKFQVHVKGNMGYESNWNGQRQHITVLGGGQKVFFAITGNNALYGNYSDGDGNMVRSDFRKMGYTGKLGFSPAKDHIVTLTYSEFFARDVAFPALSMDERIDNTKLYSLDYKAKNVSKTISTLEFKAYYSDVDHTMDNNERSFGDTVSAIANILAKKMGYRFEAGLNVAKGHLFVGTDFYQINKDGHRDKIMIGQNPKPDGSIPVKIEKLWNNASITNFGFFTEYKRNIGSLEMVGALRYDYNTAQSDSISLMNMKGVDLLGTPADSTKSKFSNFSFSIGATQDLSENLSVGASIGRGVRSGGMIERFIISLPVGFDNYEYIGNPNLNPEANNEIDLVIKYHDDNIGSFEITGFYSIITDYIGGVYIPKSVQKPLSAQVLGVKKFDNLGTANMSGFEFGYASPSKNKWKLTATAAYTQGKIKEVEVFEFDNAGNATSSQIVKNDPLAEIPPLDAKINFSYKFIDGKIVPKLGYRFVAKQNRISAANLEPTSPSFSLINFSLLYKYNQYLEVVAGVNNLLNTTYTEHLNRRVLGTNYRIPEPGRIMYVNLIFNF